MLFVFCFFPEDNAHSFKLLLHLIQCSNFLFLPEDVLVKVLKMT